MKCFLFEELADRYAGKLALSHIFPGLVDGPAFLDGNNPTWFKGLWYILRPLLRLTYMTSAEDCGDIMVSLAMDPYRTKGAGNDGKKGEGIRGTQGEIGGGAYALGQRGDSQTKDVLYKGARTGDMGRKVWEHTMGILEGAEKNRK